MGAHFEASIQKIQLPIQTTGNQLPDYTILRFALKRNTSNREVWDRILRRLNWDGSPLEVSIGVENGSAWSTWIAKDKPPPTDHYYQLYRTLILKVFPKGMTFVAGSLFSSQLLRVCG